MPELPEVETISRDLNSYISGRKIISADVYDSRNLKNISSELFINSITGTTILRVYRAGKACVWDLSNNLSIIFHLRMTGKFIIQAIGIQSEKHTMIRINTDKEDIIFIDIRKFATINLVKTSELNSNNYIKNIGIDPTTEAFTIEYFRSIVNKLPRMNIKQFLLEQKHVTGIGNIYASEILFASRILPTRLIEGLSKTEINLLYTSIITILNKAIELRGTTFSDYRDSFDKKGGFQNELKVYNNTKGKCSNCNNTITKIKQNGRSTFLCSQCQK